MPALLIRHKVADYATWKPVFDEHDATRRAHGCQGDRLFRNSADLNELLLLLEWDDLDRARLFIQSDDLQDAWTRAGVTDEPGIWYLVESELTPDEATDRPALP